MWKWIGIVVALGIIGVLVYVGMTQATPVLVAAAEKGEIRAYVEERARTTLPRIHCVTMPLDGRIQPIQLREGAEVTPDMVIATLDDSDLKTSEVEALARVGSIKSQIKVNEYNKLEETALKESDKWIASMAATVAASEKKVEASRLRREYAEWWKKSQENLFRGDATPEKELKQARTEFAQAEVEYQSDQLQHSAMVIMKEITNLYPVYIRQYLDKKLLDRDVLKQDLAGAEAHLGKVGRDLGRTTIKSPIRGVVLKRHVSDERVLSAGAPLLDLGCLDDLEVTADILSEDVVNVKVGNPADIFGAAIGAKPIRGSVVRINPQGFTKVSSLGVEQQRVAVVVAFNKDDLAALQKEGRALGVEYRVRVRIYTDTREQAVRIPRTALFRGSGGKWRAFTVRDGRAQMTDLNVGITNDTDAEIVSGVSAGDIVIVAPESALTSGTRVRYDKP